MCIDTERFEQAKNRVIGLNRQRQGIGTLSEKTVHAVLKSDYARFRHGPLTICAESLRRFCRFILSRSSIRFRM